MEAQAELGGHLDLSLEQPAGAGRKYIMVIGGGGAATERELGESDLGGGPLPVLVDGGPDGLEVGKPFEGPSLLSPHPRERLIQVMMGIGRARQRDKPSSANDLGLFANGRS